SPRRGNALQRALGITPSRSTFGGRISPRRGNALQRALGITPGGMGNGRSRSYGGRGISGAVPTRQRKAIKRTVRKTGSSGMRL
ncbi:hypothetical protein ABZ801_31360, partial [Actinomadura sp. NPDC047616]|uniref:hypothetical protein n=1 Tax=Actinomadura sp. NPDC047616 TaxID=3155914 RepID=UPI0033D2AA84